jgi:hypothetical protein
VLNLIDRTSLLKDLNREKDPHFSLILEAITLALRPYSTGNFSLWMADDSFDGRDEQTLVIECENFPKWPFAFRINRASFDDCCIEKTAWDAADEAYRWFFFRPTLPVDDHIILGED